MSRNPSNYELSGFKGYMFTDMSFFEFSVCDAGFQTLQFSGVPLYDKSFQMCQFSGFQCVMQVFRGVRFRGYQCMIHAFRVVRFRVSLFDASFQRCQFSEKGRGIQCLTQIFKVSVCDGSTAWYMYSDILDLFFFLYNRQEYYRTRLYE